MRKILFRAKRRDNNVWIFGEPHIESAAIPHIHVRAGEQHQIIPETLCQFTGLTDKNGKEIFEGDILHSIYEDKAEPSGAGRIYNEVAFREGAFGWIGEITNDFFPFDGSEIKEEVIGNIHDNPELLTK